MSSFVSGGGGGSKYEDIIQSSIESNGLGYLETETTMTVIPLTTISNFDENRSADITSISENYTQTMYNNCIYMVTLNGISNIAVLESNVDGSTTLPIYNFGYKTGTSDNPNAVIYSYNDSVILQIQYGTTVTLQVDIVVRNNDINPIYIPKNTFIAEYGITGFDDVMDAFLNGKTILVKGQRYQELENMHVNVFARLIKPLYKTANDRIPYGFQFYALYENYGSIILEFISLISPIENNSGWGSYTTMMATSNMVDWVRPWYGTCATGANSSAKVVSCSGFTLHTGVTIDVKFKYAHTTSSATLNVNSTGAKTVTGATSGAWNAGDVVKFTYDGTNWYIVGNRKWNDIELVKQTGSVSGDTVYVPYINTSTPTVPANWRSAQFYPVVKTPTSNYIAKYDANAYLNSTTPTSGDDSTKVATTAFVQDAVEAIDALPSQTGNSGKFLTTNGTAASWTNAPTELFKCTYGTTTYSEIATVINYKLPYLQKGRKRYIYSGSIGDGNYETLCFDNVSNGILSRITCSDMNVWTELTAITVVPNTRTVNSKALSSDITLTASDVGALPSSTTIPAQISKIYTGTCTTDYLTAAKVVTLDEATGFSLVDGRKVLVTFTNGNNYQGTATVNVNNTGAYTLCAPAGINSYIDNNYLSANFITQGESILLTYKSGTGWIQTTSASLTTSQSIILADKQKVITVSTSEPTSADGVDGDIWFVYEE